MVWKKKEKPLTPEEAIARAKKDLAPYWFNTEPLLAAIKTESGASALPLSLDFVGHPWLFFFADPGEYSGQGVFQIAREWHKRYHNHKLGSIIFLRPNAVSANVSAGLIRESQISFPVAFDHDGLFSEAFRIKEWPAIVMQNGASEIFNVQGKNWPEDTESKVQQNLRQVDPGLALPLSYPLKHPIAEEAKINVGSKGNSSSSMRVVGNWTQGEDFIRTQDPHASLEVTITAPWLSIIARSTLDTQPTKIVTEVIDGSLSEDLLPASVHLDDNGRAIARVQHIGLHHLLKNVPTAKRRVRLSFPDTETIPILIYGLRFGR